MEEQRIINYFQRPWGFYFKFFEEKGVWVKRVEVNPGSRLSLQRHKCRSEKWNVISGIGLVTLDDKEIKVQAGTVVDVPVGAVHRIANTGRDKLVFIEVACGDILLEDDIDRIQDDYARSSGNGIEEGKVE
ncbi:MAG: phosphomannose isomerase type II C-terminal cupin domain [Candidatus Zapsychrus exili]|nr:phosphomannose isomerase type II C-terminal cupin domain [Candidatus Zapsychrus exili]